MNAIIKPLRELADFEDTKSALINEEICVAVSGCTDSQKVHMLEGLGDEFQMKVIATFSDKRVKEIVEDMRLYERNVYSYPAKDLIFYQADIHGNRLMTERIRTLRRIAQGLPITVVTTFDALMNAQVPISVFSSNILTVKKQAVLEESELAAKLVAMGYTRSYQVEEPGQFSIRGGIVDIFDLTEENPCRIELWGDEVDSIRSFDILSQRSIENLESISIYPATEIILSKGQLEAGLKRIKEETEHNCESFRKAFQTEEAHRLKMQFEELKENLTQLGRMTNLESYIGYFYEKCHSFLELFPKDKTLLVLDEPSRIAEHAHAIETEFRESMVNRIAKGFMLPGQMGIFISFEAASAGLQRHHVLTISTMEEKGALIKPERKLQVTVKGIAPYRNSFELLVKDLLHYKKNKYRVILLSGSRTRAKRLAADLREWGVTAVYTEDAFREAKEGETLVLYGHVGKGFEYPLIKFVVISESDIFGAEKKKKKLKKKYDGQKIKDFNELHIGDYVVHETHGLGIYKGIEKIEVERVVKDYMKIEYRDGGNLYVPATGLDLIQKYASADARKPKLNKLGSKEWTTTKKKVRMAVNEVAKDLVQLYAARTQNTGYQYGKDTVWQREFEEMFPYEETDDQLHAIADTKADMESTKIMDRLICGDVGYGKTEIAIRAAFKAVSESKQVAFLVPTTILAQQHYQTFVQRMKDFPIRIDMLSRFRTTAEQKKTLEDLKKGHVDIVIGTHRLLSADVAFKDLGLLVVDEEQRFGVTHKEKIKKLKENVDVLTLSATPIPRTLHMSLVGIRDMSVLEEAPNERLPIQTYVMEYNEELVREAIVRELSRDGQVYYVYNRVNNIADIAVRIQNLVPEASVAFAHGQMKESELEHIMYDFINHEIDVLVSTTIIETGLDISNVNTIIIHDSDQLGLSQLYQLRGRVGRSNRTSYAFLMYKRDKMLREVAEKRLEAIREFTDLGSGFRIAMRDLEIRGAGNLLGQRQHGHMESVGYEMYCKMLNEAVKNLKGISTELEDFNTLADLDVNAYIPAEYIVNEVQKLDIYKRIAGIETLQESEDMEGELKDRFGVVPKSVQNLLRISLIRVAAHKLYITECRGKNEQIRLQLRPDAKLRVEGIPDFLKLHEKKLRFIPGKNPCFVYRYKKTGMVEKDEEKLLELTEQLLKDMEIYLGMGTDGQKG